MLCPKNKSITNVIEYFIDIMCYATDTRKKNSTGSSFKVGIRFFQ